MFRLHVHLGVKGLLEDGEECWKYMAPGSGHDEGSRHRDTSRSPRLGRSLQAIAVHADVGRSARFSVFFMFCIRAALARVAAIRFPNGAGRAGRDRDIREEVFGSMMWSRNPLRRCLG